MIILTSVLNEISSCFKEKRGKSTLGFLINDIFPLTLCIVEVLGLLLHDLLVCAGVTLMIIAGVRHALHMTTFCLIFVH